MNKPSDQQTSPRQSTSGNPTQTNTVPDSERKQYPREAAPETTDTDADEPNDEIKDPREDDDAKTPLRAKKHNGDGASE